MVSVDKSKSEQGKQELWNAIRSALISSRKGPPMEQVSRDGALPLSFAQQRFWFLEQLVPGTSVNNIPVTFRLTGLLNVTALEQSLAEIVRRHEVLRTTFQVVDGQAAQIISPTLTLILPIVDLRELPETERETEARRQVIQEVQQPFDLAQGPLIRVKLLLLAEEDHQLILTMHHIISDGGSFRVLFQELTLLYKAFSTDKPSSLSELPIQYADFAVWQHNWLHGEILESQLNYWKQQLCGNLPVLQLPTDYSRPAVQTYRGTAHFLKLSKDLTEKLKSLSQKEGVTLFMTVLTAFQILLARYCGQEDIIVGAPIAGRNRVEIKGLIGCFINSLSIRTNLGGNPSFLELLSQVREIVLKAYAHQDLPFEKLVKELQPARDPSRPALFQVAFILEKAPMQDVEFSGLTLTSLQVHKGTATLDLTLELEETLEGISGWFEYNIDLFEATTIARMAGHFQTLLEGIIANPEQHLWDLPLLTAAEQHQLLVEWNNTQTDYPNNTCIHQLFEAQVERTPNAIAVIFENQQLTYLELNAKANQLAHYLQKLGVEPEVLVGICVERSLNLIVGLLAILKAGGTYVPLDPDYPTECLAFILEDTQVPVLLTQQPLVEKLPSNKAYVICLDTDWKAFAKESQENFVSEVTLDNLAYLIYTSGSTGKPKGVAMEHRPLSNLISWQLRNSTLNKRAKTLQFTSLSFDVSFQEIFLTLCSGGILILVSEELRRDPVALLRFLTEEAVERLFLPFVALQQLAEAIDSAQAYPTSLREIITAGEQLKITASITRLLRKLTSCSLHNQYGPSESHVVTSFTLAGSPNSWNTLPPIGRPISNSQIYILDTRMQPVPIGFAGELHIGGVSLARGYLNRPDLTTEKFIPNPFHNSTFNKSNRLYKTGDLARYLPDGNIEFLGRLDNQVKIRGFRIELGEIEAAIAQHASVQQTVVTTREDNSSDKRLVAYIVPHPEQTVTTYELRRFLKQKLPDYMLPSAFVFLDTLPLTPNGKVDRLALPAPDPANQESEATFVAPRDELELHLTKTWEKVLSIQGIGVRDNFFDLGGHSLLVVRLFAEIKKVFNNDLPLNVLFQAPTVEQLASILRQKGWSVSEGHSSESKKSTTEVEHQINLLNQERWSAFQSSLIPIQPNGFKPPLLCIHVLGRGLKFYRPLANNLGSEQPLYGLAAQILDKKYAPPNRVKDLAAHYIKEMRILQPEGPYFLAGLSFGGLVAFEVAQQLVAQGQQVALLALLDTYAPGAVKQLSVRERISAHWSNFVRLGPTYVLGKAIENVKGKIQRLNNQLNHSFKKISCKFYQSIGQPLPDYLQDFTFQQENQEASKDYIPQAYPGRVTLFRCMDRTVGVSSYCDPQLGWSELAPGGLEIHDVPGDNFSMLQEPHVQVLAEKLKACIDRVQADDLAHIPPQHSDPFVCDRENPEG